MNVKTWATALLLATTLWAPASGVEPASTMPKVGDPAPDFTLPDQHNKPVKLADFKGQQAVVLAWFVKAGTAG